MMSVMGGGDFCSFVGVVLHMQSCCCKLIKVRCCGHVLRMERRGEVASKVLKMENAEEDD
jgi:hypothetical protein